MKRTQIKTTFRFYDQGLQEWEEGDKRDSLLDNLAIAIGRIIMEFNSLENDINWYIKEKLSHSEGEDETIFLFLSKMGVNDKIEFLTKLYGQWIYRDYQFNFLREPLKTIEQKLNEAIKIRNRYAHTDWTQVYNDRLFKIKTEAKKDGVYHTFMKFDETHLKEDFELIENLHDELYEFDENYINTLTTSTSRLLIFSYGSNMMHKRLLKRVSSTKHIGKGKVTGYKLKFYKKSKDGSGKATLIKTNDKKDNVWGSISTILADEKHLLTKAEGSGYQDKTIEVITDTNELVIALAYISDESEIDAHLSPYDWYKTIVLKGAKEIGLPHDYIEYIESISSINDSNSDRAAKELEILNP